MNGKDINNDPEKTNFPSNRTTSELVGLVENELAKIEDEKLKKL